MLEVRQHLRECLGTLVGEFEVVVLPVVDLVPALDLLEPRVH